MSQLLAVLAVLLLAGNGLLLARAARVCRLTVTKDPASAAVAPGSDVSLSALIECTEDSARQTYRPANDIGVAWLVQRPPSQSVTYSNVSPCGLGGVPCILRSSSSERRADSATPPADRQGVAPKGFCVIDPCGLFPERTPGQEALKSVRRDDFDIDAVVTATRENGVASFTLTSATEGNVTVYVEPAAPTDSAVVGVAWATPARLVLSPHKAVRHCGQPVKITARLVSVDNNPIGGANITFGVTGDCVPKLSGKVATTDADGYATLHLFSEEPGTVAVVAAAVGVDGTPLLSAAAKVIFVEESYHEEEGYYREDAAKDHKHADAASKQALAEIQAQRN